MNIIDFDPYISCARLSKMVKLAWKYRAMTRRQCKDCKKYNLYNWEHAIYPCCGIDNANYDFLSSSPKPESCCPDWESK